jgi:hypothetical protein
MEADSLQDRNRGAANARWIFVSIRGGFRRYAGEAFPFVGQPFECQETKLATMRAVYKLAFYLSFSVTLFQL